MYRGNEKPGGPDHWLATLSEIKSQSKMRDTVLQYNIDKNIGRYPISELHTRTHICTLTYAYEHNYMNMDTKCPHTPTHTHQHTWTNTHTSHKVYSICQINEWNIRH